ncbi:hypothetical protein [Shewanella atlantica]|uniref:Uncharacterized protein n=1 Tax=Shewanella atlantica TaxID=271099 RepID=A0A3S0IFB4_9GAMM|nr:hypothetical protein [Shewanella atlantica]RTR34227.1 hypothetical protein EKG39_00675 [Shewanella atlantica]
MEIGNKNEFCFVIGEAKDTDIQVVDIWLSGSLVTYFDNSVYVPQFLESLRQELSILESGSIPAGYIALALGPTTDDVSARFKIIGPDLEISFELGESQPKVTHVSLSSTIAAYRECIGLLGE